MIINLQVWAVLINDFDLAKLFWSHCNGAVANAIVATKILRAMADSEVSFLIYANFD